MRVAASPRVAVAGAGRRCRGGHDLEKADSHRAAGVKVQLTGNKQQYTATTSDGGTFRIANVPAGQYTVALDSHELMTPGGLRPIQVAGPDPVRLDLELMPWARIRGRVLDDQGKPVEKAQIEMMRYRGGGGSIARTEADGSFVISGMGPGAYMLIAPPGAAEWAARRAAGASGRGRTHDLGADLFPEWHRSFAGPGDFRPRRFRPAEL